MRTKPLHFHLKEGYQPYAATKPIPVPHHFKDEVREELEADVRKGILRKVPVGERPGDFCLQMLIMTKKNGRPRRVVDFQPLNKYIEREVHFTPTPFQAVSNIPARMYKTISDAVSGYHQTPIDEESTKLTTFITDNGRYQYLRAPQGHISSGDGYTRAYDEIIAEIQRKEKITDDVCLYDNDICKVPGAR